MVACVINFVGCSSWLDATNVLQGGVAGPFCFIAQVNLPPLYLCSQWSIIGGQYICLTPQLLSIFGAAYIYMPKVKQHLGLFLVSDLDLSPDWVLPSLRHQPKLHWAAHFEWIRLRSAFVCWLSLKEESPPSNWKYENRLSKKISGILSKMTNRKDDHSLTCRVCSILQSVPNVEGDHVGFNTGNGEKLSYSQAKQSRPAAWL